MFVCFVFFLGRFWTLMDGLWPNLSIDPTQMKRSAVSLNLLLIVDVVMWCVCLTRRLFLLLLLADFRPTPSAPYLFWYILGLDLAICCFDRRLCSSFYSLSTFSTRHSLNYFPFVDVERSSHNQQTNERQFISLAEMADGNKRIVTISLYCSGGGSSRLYSLSCVLCRPITNKREPRYNCSCSSCTSFFSFL